MRSCWSQGTALQQPSGAAQQGWQLCELADLTQCPETQGFMENIAQTAALSHPSFLSDSKSTLLWLQRHWPDCSVTCPNPGLLNEE